MLSFLLVSNFMIGSIKYCECFKIARPMKRCLVKWYYKNSFTFSRSHICFLHNCPFQWKLVLCLHAAAECMEGNFINTDNIDFTEHSFRFLYLRIWNGFYYMKLPCFTIPGTVEDLAYPHSCHPLWTCLAFGIFLK